MNNKGFIATSLLYTFFLVFLSLLLALAGDYLSNETILKRVNEDIENGLNGSKYTVSAYSYNNEIDGSYHFYNLIQNSNFKENKDDAQHDGIAYWNKSVDSLNTTNQDAGIDSTRGGLLLNGDGYITPTYLTLSDSHQYYYQINLRQRNGGTSSTPFFGIVNPNGDLSTQNYNSIDMASRTPSFIFSDATKKTGYMLMPQRNILPLELRLSGGFNNLIVENVMLIDLTATFGTDADNLPKESWFQGGIEYFEDNMYLYKKKNIEAGKSVSFAFKETITDTPACTGISNSDIKVDNSSGKTVITLNNINSDVICHFGG